MPGNSWRLHTLAALLLLLLDSYHATQTSQSGYQLKSDCPVCIRVVRAARDLAGNSGSLGSASDSLKRYCDLGTNLSVEEQKFCYNTENVRKDINRLLDLGADEFRVCKKVKSMNPDFCRIMKTTAKSDGVQLNERHKRGVIYI